MQIYKLLPKTNCKDCGLPTCMAFAMQIAAAPPMKLVKIGAGDAVFQCGQETVMFRHEEKFHNGTGVAVRIPAFLSDEECLAKVEAINGSVFQRVGEELKTALVAVEVDGCDDPSGRAKVVADKSNVPLILIGNDADKLKAALDAVKDKKPLVFKADAGTVDVLAEACAQVKAPLAVSAGNLDELADVAGKAKDKGVEEIALAVGSENAGETLRNLTVARRAALKKTFRALGYPAMVDIQVDNPELATVLASSFAAKYASIVIVDAVDPWAILPILTTVQNIYTDPQVPNTVETKLYEVGSPNENSPVMFTTNFSLTYFSVEGEVERSKIPSYICVVETEGLGVLNAYAGDKISAEKVIETLKAQGVADKVKHRKLIIPGLLPIFRAELEDASEWKEVIIGPETASKIPAFLNEIWK